MDEAAWFSIQGELHIAIEILTYLYEEMEVDKETANRLNFEENYISLWN